MRAGHKYNERVEVILGRSRRADVFVALGAVATATLLAAMPLPLELHACGLAWIGACALGALRRLRPGVRLALDAHGDIEVDAVVGVVAAGCFVAPWLTIARWRPAGAWLDRTLLLTPDRMAAEDFRRLRVILRWGK
jgi:hypothetical protein